MNALKHSGLRHCLQSPDLKTSVYFFYSPSNKRNPVLIISLKVPIISSKPICEALAKHLVLLHLYSPSPLLLAFFLNKRDYDSAWGLLQKAFSRRRKRLDTGYIVTIKVLGLKIYPFWRKINDVFRFRHYHQAYFLKKDQNQALLKATHTIMWPSILYQIRYKTLFFMPNKHIMTLHFKNTVTQSPIYSKPWLFSIIHHLTLKQSQLMYCWKWSQFWVK